MTAQAAAGRFARVSLLATIPFGYVGKSATCRILMPISALSGIDPALDFQRLRFAVNDCGIDATRAKNVRREDIADGLHSERHFQRGQLG